MSDRISKRKERRVFGRRKVHLSSVLGADHYVIEMLADGLRVRRKFQRAQQSVKVGFDLLIELVCGKLVASDRQVYRLLMRSGGVLVTMLPEDDESNCRMVSHHSIIDSSLNQLRMFK